MKRLDAVAFFRFGKVRLLSVDMFNHKNCEILQGVTFGIDSDYARKYAKNISRNYARKYARKVAVN